MIFLMYFYVCKWKGYEIINWSYFEYVEKGIPFNIPSAEQYQVNISGDNVLNSVQKCIA